MAIDVRQIGGIKANDSSDSALIAALDSRYGSSLGSGGGATVLPTFNPSNTVIFGSPGVSITPASTGSSTYNVQLGLPASLEAVTSGGGSGSVTVATTLEHGSVGGSDVSTTWGVHPRLDSSNSNKYLLDLTLPTNASLVGTGGGSNPATVGVTLNNGSVGATASDWGVKVRQGTTANSYYLDLHLPSNASVAGTGSVGSSNLSFTSADAVYTLSSASANQAKVSISGSGTNYTTKLILPAAASQSGGGGNGISTIICNNIDDAASLSSWGATVNPNNECYMSLSLPLGMMPSSSAGSVPGGTTPKICTGLDWIVLPDEYYIPIGQNAGLGLKKQIPTGFSAVKCKAQLKPGESPVTSFAECYGMCLKAGEGNNAAMIGFFLVSTYNVSDVPDSCEFRFVYSFSNDSNLNGFRLFDLYDRDLLNNNKTARSVMFTPWLDVGTMRVMQFASGLANYNVASEGFLPLTVVISNAKDPIYTVKSGNYNAHDERPPASDNSTAVKYYLLMMKRTDVNRNGWPAFGGLGINSYGKPIYLTVARKDESTATFTTGELQTKGDVSWDINITQ